MKARSQNEIIFLPSTPTRLRTVKNEVQNIITPSLRLSRASRHCREQVHLGRGVPRLFMF